jgi:hypothetical protein
MVQSFLICTDTKHYRDSEIKNGERSLGGSSPSCAITSITNDITCTSQTLQNLLGVKNQVIVKFCKLSRLRWAAHVICQDDDDLSRTVLLSEPGGKCPRGRRRLRWEDGAEEDVARLGCRNWTEVALNREGWRKLLKEAEAHHGL